MPNDIRLDPELTPVSELLFASACCIVERSKDTTLIDLLAHTEVEIKMLSRTAARLPTTVARRGFHTTRPQFSSPYHYPEGPRSNIPFNPLTRFFYLRYWGFVLTGFSAPFLIAVWQTKKNQ